MRDDGDDGEMMAMIVLMAVFCLSLVWVFGFHFVLAIVSLSAGPSCRLIPFSRLRNLQVK